MVWFLIWILPYATWSETADAAPPPMPAEEIQRAVRELGHDDYATRRRATHELWEAGEAAEPALQKALASPDPEVASRARWILERLRFGLQPNTPPPIVQAIEQFRYGNEALRRTVLKHLIDSGRIELAVRLIGSETDPAVSERLTRWMVDDIGKNVRQLILDGSLPVARQLLELAARSEVGYQDFAAYLLVRRELDAELARRIARLEQAPSVQEARLLGYLHRAKGDLPAALHVFDVEAGAPRAARGVLAELGDWEELARRLDDTSVVGDDPSAENDDEDSLEALAVAAAVHGLAGNTALFNSACERLAEAAGQNPADSWYAAEALLIAGRIDEGVRLFAEHGHAQTAFDLLVAQLRFDEAFRVAGMNGPSHPFDLTADDAEQATDISAARFALGLSVAQALHRLGWTAEAETLFGQLATAASEAPELHLGAVCRAEREAGLDASAFRRAAAAIDEPSVAPLLRALFPKQAAEASRWWSFLAEWRPEAEPAERLARVRALVERALPEQELLAFAQEAEEHLDVAAPEQRAELIILIGELRLAAADVDGGKRCFERAVQLDRSADTLVRLADFHFSRRQWPAAAEAYEAAIGLAAGQAPESIAHLVYLEGYARTMMGDEEPGQRLIATARLLPLGSARVRHALAEALKQRGLVKEAARQWQVTLRTGQFNDWAVNDAAKQLGNALSGSDGFRAAGYWQRLLLSCLKRNANLAKADGYLKLIQLIHRLRARGHLEAADTEQALREIWLAHAAMPGDVALVCDLVPRLEKAGLEAEADRLFEAAYAHLSIALAEHPGAASLWNNTAWMAATCDRRLDDALRLAQHATQLVPESPVYLDTLAEVHFRRGDREKALELARRCVELDPEHDHYRQQLDRFEKVQSDRPDAGSG